ncbi:hypothetical protein EVAR_65831_1 [Eumeta japonica]|uniref:Uncharacterized protein n=1 Tax=Eumeta variegata TaxID=151549 RepID=A0A4C1ZM55_EUMVA|nr:hypothetical protein EVAR_65831_1 [Eumeta japonica]
MRFYNNGAVGQRAVRKSKLRSVTASDNNSPLTRNGRRNGKPLFYGATTRDNSGTPLKALIAGPLRRAALYRDAGRGRAVARFSFRLRELEARLSEIEAQDMNRCVCLSLSLSLSRSVSLALRRANCARVEGTRAFHFLCLSLSLLGGLTMPEWKGRVPLTRSHCERITQPPNRQTDYPRIRSLAPCLIFDPPAPPRAARHRARAASAVSARAPHHFSVFAIYFIYPLHAAPRMPFLRLKGTACVTSARFQLRVSVYVRREIYEPTRSLVRHDGKEVAADVSTDGAPGDRHVNISEINAHSLRKMVRI